MWGMWGKIGLYGDFGRCGGNHLQHPAVYLLIHIDVLRFIRVSVQRRCWQNIPIIAVFSFSLPRGRGDFRFSPQGKPSSERHGFALHFRSRLSRAFRTSNSLHLSAVHNGRLLSPPLSTLPCSQNITLLLSVTGSSRAPFHGQRSFPVYLDNSERHGFVLHCRSHAPHAFRTSNSLYLPRAALISGS